MPGQDAVHQGEVHGEDDMSPRFNWKPIDELIERRKMADKDCPACEGSGDLHWTFGTDECPCVKMGKDVVGGLSIVEPAGGELSVVEVGKLSEA
jgi:hypothetical protein